MTAWIVPALVTGFALAILGVQYLVFRQGRKDLLYFAALMGHRLAVLKLRVNHIDSALEEHNASSALFHAQTHGEVDKAVRHFCACAGDLAANAGALKVHAQELLDRSEARAISPRQAVTRQ